jgi:hypothetical protein
MKDESQHRKPAQPKSPATRSADELDREPASNRGHRGQMRESRNVARSAEEDIQTMGSRQGRSIAEMTALRHPGRFHGRHASSTLRGSPR